MVALILKNNNIDTTNIDNFDDVCKIVGGEELENRVDLFASNEESCVRLASNGDIFANNKVVVVDKNEFASKILGKDSYGVCVVYKVRFLRLEDGDDEVITDLSDDEINKIKDYLNEV